MGDISHEPTMEEILASIKRIIAEDGDAATPSRRVRPSPFPQAPAADPDEVLELTDPLDPEPEAEAAEEPVAIEPEAEPEPETETEPQPEPDTLVSTDAAEASRAALAELSAAASPEPDANEAFPLPGAARSVEDLARELLRPMLREWLDANLPALVEAIVRREIERITRDRG
ncbi:MAG: DUF2497 domain-containing protein [Sphingomonadaceae bacterium]|nr:DUF2497 domain-containing protein [Sphingomonadaceae bacterium]